MTQQYKCPKCLCFTCSYVCYRNHNTNKCLEDFCKQQVIAKLKATKTSETESKNFQKNCSIFNKKIDPNSTTEMGLQKLDQTLIQKLLANNFELECLSEEETNLFFEFLKEYKQNPWKPIWFFDYDLPNEKIQEIQYEKYFENCVPYSILIENLCFENETAVKKNQANKIGEIIRRRRRPCIRT